MHNFSTSVLMSCFWKDNLTYLDAALESLYLQTLPPNEIIIVFEGEINDDFQSVFDKWTPLFKNSSFKLIPALDSKGLPACLNKGLKAAKGEYIIRFDSDDYCYPNRIEAQIDFFKQNPEVVLLSAPLEEYDESLKELLSIRSVPLLHDDIIKYAKWRDPFNHPTTAYRRDIALELGGYPLLTATEDYAFFCTFLVKGYKSANLESVLVKARAGKELANRRTGNHFLAGEIKSIKYIHDVGFFSYPVYRSQILLKNIIRRMPKSFVGLFYRIFLR